jgi:uncharacterized protein
MSAPRHRVGRRFWLWPLLGLLGLYRYAISPVLHFFAPGWGCRYEPGCSRYAIEAILAHGAIKGVWLAARRFLDCHPWGHFGIDPVPGRWPGWFRRRRHYYGAGAEAPSAKALPRCCHRASHPS